MAAKEKPIMLALSSSPRPRGASARLLSAFLQGLQGWRIVRLSLPELGIAPYAAPARKSVVQSPSAPNDFMPSLIDWFDRASAMVVAAPVYFYGFPSQAKAVIDRCHPLWHSRYWKTRPRRPGYFLATCAAPRPTEFEVIIKEARAFFNTVAFTYTADLLLPGLDSSDAAARLQPALLQARRLGACASIAETKQKKED